LVSKVAVLVREAERVAADEMALGTEGEEKISSGVMAWRSRTTRAT
jgi:hypothetical protein